MIPIIFWMITSIENASDEVTKAEEDSGWKGFSVVLHLLLPIAGLALLWRQRGIFSKLLLQLDRSCVSVYCPSLSKREKLLKWASGRLPSTWSSQARTLSSGIPELWKDGSLLCTLINSVVPGACPNPHRHWRKPPLHAQALAYKYLGLVPMFTEDELSDEFTINQEKNFIHYLQKLQEAINKWPTKDENRNFSTQYVARGMGLFTGEQYRKTVFYVYSNVTAKKRGNVLMYIRGPYGTKGKATISPFHNLKTIPVVNVLQDQLEATKILPFKSEEQKSFLKTISLDFTSLVSNEEDKENNDEIPIQIDMEIDRAKITYIPKNTGIYEINLICEGELLRGSPYNVQVINNTSGKRDSFSIDSENVEEKITFTKRKILSKVIDCIDEKICIENDKVSKIIFDNRDSSSESDNDITITAITKKKDEILKTEINCTLENIIEEINSVQDKTALDTTESERKNKEANNALEEIKKIAENLKLEIDMNKETNTMVNLKVDSQHKRVKNCEEAKVEIVNLLQQEHIDEVDNINEYNKNIDIPEEKLISKLDINLVESTKYLKNIVNTTSRQEMLGKILPAQLLSKKEVGEDENNNSPKKAPLKRIKSKIYFEITPNNVPKTPAPAPPPVDSLDITSPICPDHIVPEVEKCSLNQLTLTEKRKIFSKQNSVSIPDCCDNFTFSISENEEPSKSKDSTFRELSVLNVLDSLRQSRKNSLSDTYSLSAATSLPNMMSLESDNYEINFKERKDYWERLSSRSSSSVSLANSDYSQSKKKAVTNKNFFNKFNLAGFKHNSAKIDETARSVDNLTLIKYNNDDGDRQYKSFDTSLEDCTIIPIEERKKQLLKNFYDQEKSTPKKLNVKITFSKKTTKPKNETNNTFFTPVSERIQTFDKKSAKPKLVNIAPQQAAEPVKEAKKSTKHSIKSQFKRAIKFFKNLEENSKIKSKDNQNKKRRFSLDCQKKNNQQVRKGGSLRLPHISERFSVNNLYEDVFGNKNGSFKGTPNKTGVANSLASFSRDPESDDLNMQEENSISYNLFTSKSKNKKRKSIKTLFDVNYY